MGMGIYLMVASFVMVILKPNRGSFVGVVQFYCLFFMTEVCSYICPLSGDI
jgi:hypothetical protein